MKEKADGREGQASEMPSQLVFWILALLGLVIVILLVTKGNDLFRNLFGT